MKGQHLVAEFLSTPWALQPERIAAYAGIVARWQAGEKRSMEDDDGFAKPPISSFDARRSEAQSRVGSGAIAVLPLYGTIIQRAGMMTEWCGGTSTQQFTAALRDALADDSISQILIDIDSPGGSVYGVGELCAELYAARGQKNIVAVSNSLAASAAYWIGCSAAEFYVTPGGEVGSIGVWQAHEDYSAYMEEAGIKTTLISAGKFKVEGNPYQPLGEEAQTFMQSRVEDYYKAFAQGVSKGRGVSISQVRDGMGQGRVLGADAALAENMVDGIASFDEVVKKMQRAGKASAKSAARQTTRLAAARRDLDLIV
ncbi:S49 family peptidase [Ampullimonas aquatilis]|uniref:S49 family peptidase n=1 Tax=Ampullimonas aquatilis TaxID=1341549 RepID=UPI003C7313B4